jgi:hypothetical protein
MATKDPRSVERHLREIEDKHVREAQADFRQGLELLASSGELLMDFPGFKQEGGQFYALFSALCDLEERLLAYPEQIRRANEQLAQEKPVKLNTVGLKEYTQHDIDAACHFVGAFASSAREQGWTEDEIQRVVRPLTARRAHDELLPYIEHETPVGRTSMREPLIRQDQYEAGCALLAHDPEVEYKPFRFYFRAFPESIARGMRDGWFSRPAASEAPGQHAKEANIEGRTHEMAPEQEHKHVHRRR